MKAIYFQTFSIIIILFTASCIGANSDANTQAVKLINIPLDSLECLSSSIKTDKPNYKMLVYINVDMCMECSMKQIRMYKDFVQERGFQLLVVLSISQDHTKRLKYLLRSVGTEEIFLIDTTNIFQRQNPNLDPYYTQVFLLDKDNNIVIDGDPFQNDNTTKEYDKYAKD